MVFVNPGRPQYDDFGVAIIMTIKKMETKYKQLVSGKEPIESRQLIFIIG